MLIDPKRICSDVFIGLDWAKLCSTLANHHRKTGGYGREQVYSPARLQSVSGLDRTHHHLAGVHADAALDRAAAVGDHFCRVPLQLFLHAQCCIKHALRMVLVGNRRREQCEDAVAGRELRTRCVVRITVRTAFRQWAPALGAEFLAGVPIGVAGFCAGALGHVDSARERLPRAMAFAQDSNNPFDLAMARNMESWLACLLREPQRAEVAAAQALAIAEEHGFSLVRNMARTMLGWAWAQLGRAGEGVALIRQALAGMAETGSRLAITNFLSRLAEAQALDGTIDDALSTIEEALQANHEELVFRPTALTCRGDLRIKLGQTSLAEGDFREAIALAQAMQAKTWELRATTSLARLLERQGRRDDARTMLAEIYNWFTEGFDTADLKDAKALLDKLGN